MNRKELFYLILISLIGVVVLSAVTLAGHYWETPPLFVLVMVVLTLAIRRLQKSRESIDEYPARAMRKASRAFLFLGTLYVCSSTLSLIVLRDEFGVVQKVVGFFFLCFGALLLRKGWKLRAKVSASGATRESRQQE